MNTTNTQKIKNLCKSFERKFDNNIATIWVTPYFSFSQEKILVHIHKSVYKPYFKKLFEDHWYLESPTFIPIFSGNKDEVKYYNQLVLKFREDLLILSAESD